MLSEQKGVALEPGLELFEKDLGLLTMHRRGALGVSVAVFVEVEVGFEGAVIFADELVGEGLFFGGGTDPLIGIMMVQGPADNVDALVYDGSVFKDQDGDGSFGGGRQHGGRLILEKDFPYFKRAFGIG